MVWALEEETQGDSTRRRIRLMEFITIHWAIPLSSLIIQKSPTAEFYRDLEGQSNIYVQGWNDCEPIFVRYKSKYWSVRNYRKVL